MKERWEKLNLVADFFRSVLTSLAIIIGGAWATNEYIIEKPHKPRLDISQSVEAHRLTGNQTWVQVRIKMRNVGNRDINLTDGATRIHRVLPLDEKLKGTIDYKTASDERRGFVRGRFARWPVICSRRISRVIPLQPDESYIYTQEFFIPRVIDLIRVYSYFETGDGDEDSLWDHGMAYKISKNDEEMKHEIFTSDHERLFICLDSE